MAMFHVGQKVVRLPRGPRVPDAGNANLWYPDLKGNLPVVGGVYTIRAIVFRTCDGAPSLLLEEVDNSHFPGKEPSFGAKHFRPVRETSIECFRALLKSKPSDLPQDDEDRKEIERVAMDAALREWQRRSTSLITSVSRGQA